MKKGMNLVVFFMIFLVVSMPVVFSAEVDGLSVERVSVKTPLLQTNDQQKGVFGQLADSLQNMSSQYGTEMNAAEKCKEKSDKAGDKLKFMDNGVIKSLEGVLNIARAICLSLSAIDSILSTISLFVVGMMGPDGSACCVLGWLTLTAACDGEWGIYEGWSSVYKHIQPICCWLTCGWCTTGCNGLDGIFEKGGGGGGEKYGIYGAGKGDPYNEEDAFFTGGVSGIGLSPYDNIYVAVACICPGAILKNLRKLRAIYQTYDCCVQKTCAQGLSTEGCEAMLDESTCMFWEGAIISSLAKIITKLIVHLIYKYVLLTYLQQMWIKCILAAFELIQTPQTIKGIIDEWQSAMKSFSDPSCADLGFEKVGDDFSQVNDDLQNRIPLSYEDFNGDGYADGTSDEKAAYDKENLAAQQRAQALESQQKAQQAQRAFEEEQLRKAQAAQAS